MKRTAMILFTLLFASLTFGEEPPKKEYTTTREFKNRVFEVKNRDPMVMMSAVKLLGSGFQGADMSVNPELRTITVRDFPENLATIEDALKRLDQPVAGEPEIEFHVHVLIGANTPLNSRPLADELEPVVKQLQSTLRYSSYGLLTTSVHRTRPGNGIESSGVAEAKLLGMATPDTKPIFYRYWLRRISIPKDATRETTDVENFRFSMQVPIGTGSDIRYQDVGFDTPVSVRKGEKVVVGTTTMGDKALVVVVTATVNR